MFDLLGSGVFGFVQTDLRNNIGGVRARGLYFTCMALQEMQRDPKAELHVCFKRSYDVVLKHHHTFIIRSVVTIAIRAVPHRHDFYDRVAQGAPHEEFDAQLAVWLDGLEAIVTRIRQFLEQGGYGKV
ncbi:hypothetical protein EUX98_g3679 [Antrodiella citrinella]|uniref:Glycolipid transfer protein domain-containing protein n=1 Tax=Antrodiella citrinella TaxID=2447956 RepID=A0A4S4N435_9APHY|nr:hypothetical protein EUX98_g3679 [Antrodiella citrinella]